MFLFWFLISYNMRHHHFAVATSTTISSSLGRWYRLVFSISFLDVYVSNHPLKQLTILTSKIGQLSVPSMQCCRVWVGHIFEFVKLILFLKTYLWGGLAPYSQTVGSSLIYPSWQSWLGKWSEHSSIGFDKLENLTNLGNTNSSTTLITNESISNL